MSSFKRGLQFSEEKMNGNEGIVWKKNEKKWIVGGKTEKNSIMSIMILKTLGTPRSQCNRLFLETFFSNHGNEMQI